MTQTPCPETDGLLARVRCGEPATPPVTAHLERCAACREALAIEALFAGVPAGPEPPSDPDLLLLRARLRAHEAAAARAMRPVVWIERLAAPAVALAAAWVWPWLRQYLAAPGWTAPSPGFLLPLLALLTALVTVFVLLDLIGSEV